MSKVPCGGFKLDENFLGMNENDELSLTGGSEGKAYQQLVTDADGNTKWEDRLAYEVSVTSDITGLEYTIDGFNASTYTAEHSDIPLELGQVWSVTKITDGDYSYEPENAEVQKDEDGTLYIGSPPSSNVGEGNLPYSVTKNKTILSSYWYTRNYVRKIKLVGVSGTYTTTAPKQIDPKYIPSELNEIILPSSTSGSTKKFKITVDDTGTISATEVTT